jgi:hypothetical protein
MENEHIPLQRATQRNRIAASVIVSAALLVTCLFLVSDSHDELEDALPNEAHPVSTREEEEPGRTHVFQVSWVSDQRIMIH